MKIHRLVINVEGHESTKIVAVDGERFVGHVGLFIKGEWSSFNQLYVHPDYRCRFIGTELVETCCAIAKAAGATEIGISIAYCNQKVIPWYERRGFEKCYEEDGAHCFTRQLNPERERIL